MGHGRRVSRRNITVQTEHGKNQTWRAVQWANSDSPNHTAIPRIVYVQLPSTLKAGIKDAGWTPELGSDCPFGDLEAASPAERNND